MSEPAATSIRETVLRQCLAADPDPWYPKEYAEKAGLDRESLYGPLNDLRIANLVQLTDWLKGKGQGYRITVLGREVLSNPGVLAQLREGKAPAPEAAAPIPEPVGTTRFDRGEVARRAMFLPGRVRVVPVLLALNLAAFAVSFAIAVRSVGVDPMRFLGSGDAIALHKVGAVGAPDLARGEWWRLVTNSFLHFGLFHLALNMFTLSLVRRVEVLWGSGRFLVLYLICGVCGSCVGVYYSPGEPRAPVYLAGASGALWGVMTSEAAWLVINYSHLPPAEVRAWLNQIFFALLVNLGVSMLPGVSAAAHVGGGAAGVLAAGLLQVHRFGPPSRRSVASVLLALLPALFLLGMALAFEYDPRLQPFLERVHREELDERLGKLAPTLDGLEPQAEKLHLEESAKRDPAQVTKVRESLQALVKQAKESADWVGKVATGHAARPVRERGIALAEACAAYAEGLDKQLAGELVENINDLRKRWQEAKANWAKLAH
ncbi:MAG TPA: rhomboid family intramembrane serine protease [Gemmataceae bacterium]|nr:rhomboid family intramembrane serine protease [Gemmataceae bacterium]